MAREAWNRAGKKEEREGGRKTGRKERSDYLIWLGSMDGSVVTAMMMRKLP